MEWRQGELFPRVGFIVTNMSAGPEGVVHFYNGRGTAEQWIKEGKYALNWTRPSCHRFVANQVRLSLFILYDNTKLAVARILGDGRRKRTRAFTELQSHYLFSDRFGRPGKGNDKGKVEGMVGYMRRNFLVPVPSFESFEALNAHLERRCLARMDARLRGHSESIGQRMERDLEALLPLPAVAYDACEKQAGRPGEFAVAGEVQDQRLLGPGGLRAPGRSGKRLRGPGGHQLRVRGHRPPSPLLPAG